MRKELGIKPSYWENDTIFRYRQITIVGAGIVGLSTALSLKEHDPQLDILILERTEIPSGASTRNAGFACFGSVSEILDDMKTLSQAEIVKLIQMRWQGLKKLRERVGDDVLDYKDWGGYEMFTNENKKIAKECFDLIPQLNQLLEQEIGLPETYKIVKNDFGFSTSMDLIKNKHEGQIHPGRMMKALRNKCYQSEIEIIYGCPLDSHIENVNGVELILKNGVKFTTDQLVITTNAFSKKFVDKIDLIPARNQVMMTKPISGFDLKGCFHYDKGYVYFRNYKDRLLIGGGRNISEYEETSDFGITTEIQDYLRSLVNEVILPNTKWEEEMWWSGIIAIGVNKEPIIKKQSDKVYLGIRFGGMGVAIGSQAGIDLANLICNS